MPSDQKNIVLLGDSTLDNIDWVDNEEDTVAGKLKQKFQKPDQIIDLSCDGFTTRDVLSGAFRDKAVRSPYHQHTQYYPLSELKKIDNPSHIILSVGGNDLRENLIILANQSPETRRLQLKSIITGIQQRYLDILNELKTIQPNASPIIMLQYSPDSTRDLYGIYTLMNLLQKDQSLSYLTILNYYFWGKSNKAPHNAVDELHHLMQTVYAPILKYAKEQNIPVIDMASSMDHRDTRYYRSQIEPSAKGAEVIANLISHVVNNHDYSNPSCLYSQPTERPDNIVIRSNHDSWRPMRYCPDSKEEAKEIFLTEYKKRLDKDNKAWLGLYSLFAYSQIKNDMTFDQIVTHAQSTNNRSREVMQELDWLDSQNQLGLKFS
ncbi:SGNH/GDSL hydrolase family protein [Legionella bononiensis]|uniref:SGNH/GDSL hydrolase family protein n=1 Tax=Legionella bononiensis TaxID=2793102 RepID=A0ABS1W7P6_9GAMM|nr:SGNH/GDSL hydrolase family protein [Legionella bononiensis]MBL7480104.1 SGNH/GDSL hydrolase family protein [Legionella bononiensis]MBL7525381.1 SGNH/GDSL hydrolase family protein [Legionella bononiensis]MBL7561565.1 SGNH/GDSL hydrolase family protein [Legionella bononiensis]